jgi:hypothetical protein
MGEQAVTVAIAQHSSFFLNKSYEKQRNVNRGAHSVTLLPSHDDFRQQQIQNFLS